jgi:general secretion pathway protein J
MMSAGSSEQGFTLVETLISIFLLALMMSAGGAILISTLQTDRVIEERLERLNALELASAHLRSDIAAAVPRRIDTGSRGDQQLSLYGGRANRTGIVLGLVRDGWTNRQSLEDRSELLSVQYHIDNGQLLRRVYERPDVGRRTPHHDLLLLDGVSDVTLEFMAAGQPSGEWGLVLENDTPILPDSIRFEIVFETGQSLSQTFLVGGRL